MKFFNGVLESPEEAIERIDDIGGPNSHTNYPWGWAQCGNSPFKWYKQNTYGGGVNEIQREIVSMLGLRLPRAPR